MKKRNFIFIAIAAFMVFISLFFLYNGMIYKEYYSCPIPHHNIWEKLQIEIFWKGTWTGNKYGSPYEVVIRIPNTVHNKNTDFKPEEFCIWTNEYEINIPVTKMKRFGGKNGATYSYKWINLDLSKCDCVNYKLVMRESDIKYSAKISVPVKNEVKRRNKLFWLLEL
ncbi:MAG: hypothetical protein J6S53_09145 [Lentisphaeria bacterium]|nr:hypothetical protein [Lentisphaeria bacterium]